MASDDLERLRSNLEALSLRHILEHLDTHLREAQQLALGHVGFMVRATDAEVLARKGKGVRQRITKACFEEVVTLDGYDFKEQPSIDRRQILDLADESLDELLDALRKPHLMIIDELGAGPRKPEQDYGALFYELVNARHRRGAFVLVSNFAPTDWAHKLGNAPLVTAAIDRLLDGAHVITVPQDAPSYRAKRKRGAGRLPQRRLPASVRRYRRR